MPESMLPQKELERLINVLGHNRGGLLPLEDVLDRLQFSEPSFKRIARLYRLNSETLNGKLYYFGDDIDWIEEISAG